MPIYRKVYLPKETCMKNQIKIGKIEQSRGVIIKYFSQIIVTPPADFNIIHFSVSPGCTTENDRHKVRECWFILRGKGLMTLNDTDCSSVEEGELYFFDSMVSHQVFNISYEASLEILSIWW